MPRMIDLDATAPALGIIIDHAGTGGFDHVATAWSVGAGEWVTAWLGEAPDVSTLRLLTAVGGAIEPIVDWEQDGSVVGFRSGEAHSALTVTGGIELHKRQALVAVGYPAVIDHPIFQISRGSLTAERYLPYLCPWMVDGHLALFSAEEGYLTGRYYPGLRGAPVLSAGGEVVGVVEDGMGERAHPPLTRFARLSQG